MAKWDGFRFQVFKDGSDVRFFSKARNTASLLGTEKKTALRGSEGQLANGERLEVGKRAAVRAATMFSFRSIYNTQCHDSEPLWGKGKPR